jgi:hypothetical protein
MSLFRGSLLLSVIAVGLSAPTCAAESRRGQWPEERRRVNRRRQQRAHEGREAKYLGGGTPEARPT